MVFGPRGGAYSAQHLCDFLVVACMVLLEQIVKNIFTRAENCFIKWGCGLVV
jgi:hypothetical protein